MTTKLTLSVPEATVAKAKRYARERGMSVSALFTQTIEKLPQKNKRTEEILNDWKEMKTISQAFKKVAPHDERSAYLLKKHG